MTMFNEVLNKEIRYAARTHRAIFLDEASGRLTEIEAPTRRMLEDAVEMLGEGSAVFLDAFGRRDREWGECSVPLGQPCDNYIWVG